MTADRALCPATRATGEHCITEAHPGTTHWRWSAEPGSFPLAWAELDETFHNVLCVPTDPLADAPEALR